MKKTILCVDDEKIVLDTLLSQLEIALGKEYQFEIAESVEEAWEVIDYINEQGEDNICIVVSDWLMPGVKGDKFLVDLHKRYPKTVKMLLTGQADEDAVKNAMDNANLYAYIKKPWREEDLLKKINAALAQ